MSLTACNSDDRVEIGYHLLLSSNNLETKNVKSLQSVEISYRLRVNGIE